MTKSSILGYPRIGANREWKKALEAYWAGKLEEEAFTAELKRIRLEHLSKLQASGLDWIPVNDFSLYDHILDTATMFGIVPERFAYNGGPVSLQTYYGIARGTTDATAGEMTKWFNTNYHYIVPELTNVTVQLTENKPLAAYEEAKQELGINGKPVIVGPLTLVKLAKGYHKSDLSQWINKLVPVYVEVLQQLQAAGVEWVQIDEPVLVTKLNEDELASLQYIYETFAKQVPNINILLQTYFESVEQYEQVIALPVQGIGLDFAQGSEGNLASLQRFGFPSDKVLGAGIIDGRNIWGASLTEKVALLDKIVTFTSNEKLVVQSSCSLLHVPVTVQAETNLDEELKNALAFADEKVNEIVTLTKIVNNANRAAFATTLQENELRYQSFQTSANRRKEEVRAAITKIVSEPIVRNTPFVKRYEQQQAHLQLPLFPTTTIGSFPQTAEVRKARLQWRKQEWSNEQYEQFIHAEIDKWIALQEEIGLDVLVHGEFERTDMVEFFGEKLAGFAFTKNGWVQSYGSRCVKPPVIYADVAFEEAMTVAETKYAQSLTSKPVKGMLTGPITIMNWSFVRDDLPREQIAYQLAYALRQEVEALEQAGIAIIQVDEPAVREGLPLKEEEQATYLDWSVKAFRLTTGSVQPSTQIHTHMCYCEFHDMIDVIDKMDADVISIETSRSHGELIHSFEVDTYSKGIGLGVYDIHSPRVPQTEEMSQMIDRALRVLDPKIFWINPDCGLKTRGQAETIAALKNMVEATEVARARYTSSLV
ncbi:5-methyltetrahydropteroyltriglutamate--homocysteine S-methyltransferase [Paenibacillus yanchengensis]|uniref:5-methyltetrahydropteroyltriglutamate--homocysteine methyltransferase n=1 Tax=Paenibacillus yanchengensis TaxID=2035833 RepID=A0ABW4YQH7_9BACL